jgi:hypothetical protein
LKESKPCFQRIMEIKGIYKTAQKSLLILKPGFAKALLHPF